MVHEAGIPLAISLLYGNCQVHVGVNRTRDLIRSGLVEGDSLRVARIDGEARVSQFRWRVGIGDALAIVACANDVKATCVCWVNELEGHASLDCDRTYREVCRIHFNVIYRARRTGVCSTRGLATTSRRDCPKKQQGKNE